MLYHETINAIICTIIPQIEAVGQSFVTFLVHNTDNIRGMIFDGELGRNLQADDEDKNNSKPLFRVN